MAELAEVVCEAFLGLDVVGLHLAVSDRTCRCAVSVRARDGQLHYMHYEAAHDTNAVLAASVVAAGEATAIVRQAVTPTRKPDGPPVRRKR